MNICSRCGTDNNYNAQFCRGCGVVLEGNQGAATIQYKRHNALLIGLGIGGTIIVFLLIGLLFFLPPHNPLFGKWKALDGDYEGYSITFFDDGSYEFSNPSDATEDATKYTYKIYNNDEIIFYQNGEFINGFLYSIEGSTLTIKSSEVNVKYEKIE